MAGSDAGWSEENDGIPLKHRLKKLRLAANRLPEQGNVDSSVISNGVVVKKEQDQCGSQDFHSDCSSLKGKTGCLVQEQSPNGGTEVDRYTSPTQESAGEIINANDSNSLLPPLPSNFPVQVKVEQADDSGVSTLGNFVNSSSVTDVQPKVEFNTEIPGDFLDDLDHVILKERLRILLSRKGCSSTTEVLQDNSSGLCCRVEDNMVQQIIGIEQGTNSDDKVHLSAGNNFSEIHKNMISGPANEIVADVPCTTQYSTATQYYEDHKVNSNAHLKSIGDIERICSSELPKHDATCGAELSSGGNKIMLSSNMTASVNVKVEPLDGSELETINKDFMGSLTSPNVVQAKTQIGILGDDSLEDKLDHMFLSERRKLLLSSGAPHLNILGNSGCTSKEVPSALDCRPIASEYAKPLKINRPRKRKKTATDSVGKALEEDAPGLLQVLVEKGVSVDEMKLYGQTEYDGDLDDSLVEDSFSELEAVILKLYSQRSSMLKFGPIRCNKGEKAIYCLTCLFSLVEQARYLRFRNWPVEWGWCRDLQSFIFVFKRHNRIVLERPEYGYATYFFELVDSVSVDWQIKRLVTAMKLTSCSRVTLIENRALVIGEDLSEGEARVLLEFGWLPNSGLGTMLNYCDRVVHDRKNEKFISDWREKIGKLLMDGFNGGRIVAADIPGKLSENNVNQSPQIKLELN